MQLARDIEAKEEQEEWAAAVSEAANEMGTMTGYLARPFMSVSDR